MTEEITAQSREQLDHVAQPAHGDDCITIVLTADNHLGYTSFAQQSQKREEHQHRLRRAFQQATDFALGQHVDLFIQAGDLFDTPTPSELDRSFVAARLAQLHHANIPVFALGGTHDTPLKTHRWSGETAPAPQLSFAHVGVMHYFPPDPPELEPVLLTIRDQVVGICGLGVRAGQEGNPLAHLPVSHDIERATISLLLLHAPIESLSSGMSLLDTRAQVSRASIEEQSTFRFILAGYNHSYRHLRIGHSDVIIAGATQQIDFSNLATEPGFVFLGLAADGVRWCEHISAASLTLQSVVIRTTELWPTSTTSDDEAAERGLHNPTETILERLRPHCSDQAMVQLRLEGELTRRQFHQLDLNQLRRYGAAHCFSLAIDDSGLHIVSAQEASVTEVSERLSPREELIALANEWIAAAPNDQEKKALRVTKEELVAALDEVKSSI